MRINTIWTELENDMSFSIGLLLRRFSPEVLSEVYVALRVPEKLKGIAIRIDTNLMPDVNYYVGLQDIRVENINDERTKQKNILLFTLVNPLRQDVFAVLCEDLIYSIKLIRDEKKILEVLLNRFEKWKSLFETASLQGLTQEEQQGIYGELYLLRKWLLSSSPYNIEKCIHAWTGPGKALRDFQSGEVGIEVKTTTGNSHQKMHINNERQLDHRFLKLLFLYHLSAEKQYQNGETLNDIVADVINSLAGNVPMQNLFRAKLFESGYFEHHKPFYEDVGYQIRQETFYIVKDNFPRIEESELRKGIGDVKYTIVLSDFREYIVDELFIFDTLNQTNSGEYGK